MLPLDPTDDLAKPLFKDEASCAKWLSQLQLTNLNMAHATLRTQLDEFTRYPMRGNERLRTLESLRETVSTVQADFAKRLLGKKLPYSDDEFASLIGLSSLWLAMLNGYLRCFQSLDVGDSSLAKDGPLLAQRCLLYSSLQLGEFMRAGCEPDAKSWQRLHAIYAHLEERGLQRIAVSDRFNRTGHDVSASTLYAKTLLLHRARLLGLTRSQWHIADRWLDQWGDTLSVEPRCSMSKEDAPPLAVDLASARGIIPVQRATTAESMRFLAMVPLSKLIRVKTILLQQGQLPKQLELGDELNSTDCIALLNRLHACWCEAHGESLVDEPRDAPAAQMCYGLENLYAHIARKPFKQTGGANISDKEVQKQIETFGRVLDPAERQSVEELGFLADEWLVEEDGLLQARLLRKSNSSARLGNNQLVCVHKPGSDTYKAAVTTLVCVTRNGQLYAGVRYLPGLPQAAIVRGTASDNLLSGAAPALVLPEMPNLRIPASLLIPRDWFRSGRQLDLTLADETRQSVILGISVEIGNDYERVSFKPKN